MRASDYLVETLVEYGVTDVFGIPGGVVLDFLYALERRKHEICPHLMCHEQAAGFAALGYAQLSGTLGVAYATRGPGFTNLLTAIADAYQESIPVLFITAHLQQGGNSGRRMELDQELDAIALAKKITKYSARIDNLQEFVRKIKTACQCAVSGRKGPVLLDIYSLIWNQEVCGGQETDDVPADIHKTDVMSYEAVCRSLNETKRPVILAGNGVQQSGTAAEVQRLSEECRIPILTSRGSQDLFTQCDTCFGYIGSHGLRYSNFILSKADCILTLGNRLSFPLQSESYAPIVNRAKVIRIDVDQAELERPFPGSVNCNMDLREFFSRLDIRRIEPREDVWLEVCGCLKDQLFACDTAYPVDALADIFRQLPKEFSIAVDVGNHEFWTSRAYTYAGSTHRILYSRSFGTLGNALPKSIGVFFRTGKPVLCITGDQGLQMNIQELQMIASGRLPIVILLLNNHSSGMIRSHEKRKYGEWLVHTTLADGYSAPNFGAVAKAYGISYHKLYQGENLLNYFENGTVPVLLEMNIDAEIDLDLSLVKGDPCQDLTPKLERNKYRELDAL